MNGTAPPHDHGRSLAIYGWVELLIVVVICGFRDCNVAIQR